MSIFERKYRKYSGELKGRWFRIWSIATSSFRVQFSGRKIIFLLIFCNIVIMAFTLMLFFIAIFIPGDITQILFGLFNSLDVAMYTIVNFAFNPGLIFLPIVFIATINAGTIANDKKNNSLALYMAKPIDRIDYILGKALSIYMVSAFVTTIPWFIFLITFTLLRGFSSSEFFNTIWVYLSTLASSILVIFFFGSIVMFFSAINKQSVLTGILTILVLYLPILLVTIIESRLGDNGIISEIIYYFSISSLFTSAFYLVFGNPPLDESVFGIDIFMPQANGMISIIILLVIPIMMFLFTLNKLNKDEIG